MQKNNCYMFSLFSSKEIINETSRWAKQNDGYQVTEERREKRDSAGEGC